MLKDIEPKYELRLVERIDTRIVSTAIDKFPAIIGHKGTVQPLILNGQISSFHCSVEWNWVKQEYQIEDGMDGRPSTNHIYFSENGGESVLCDRAILKTPKDRLYLLRTIEGKEGYLELFDPKKEWVENAQSTLDLDPQLVEFRATAIDAKEKAIDAKGTAIEAKELAQINTVAIGALDANMDERVKQALTVLKVLGMDARLFVVGTLVFGFAGLMGLTLLFIHANMDSIYKDVRDRNQHTEQKKELDRTMTHGG